MENANRRAARLLLLGWDAADWKIIHPLLDRGALPHLARLIERGASGPLASLRPMLSPMLWTSIATGRRAAAHGVHGFTEVDPNTGRVEPVSSFSRRCKALWNILAQTGRRAQTVGWFATHPAEPLPHGGVSVSDAFIAAGASPETGVHPPRLREVIDGLRVTPHEIDANVIELFVPRWRDAGDDRRLTVLRERLAECFSVHAVATYLLEAEPGADLLAVYHRSIDWISHDFMPFHPPAMEGVSAANAALYGETVSGIYRLHDLLLGRLLELGGDGLDVIIVSDHGFHSDRLRPRAIPAVTAGIAAWHRPTGVFVASGPSFAPDELVHGATLLDLAPTALALFGLPAGADMEGRVLREALRGSAPPLESIASWETASGDAGQPSPAGRLAPEEADALRRQFAGMGYLPDAAPSVEETVRENRWNLAVDLLEARRWREALPLLEQGWWERPERADFGLQLAACQLQLGLLDEAGETLREALDGREAFPFAKALQADLAHARRDFARSLELTLEAAAGEGAPAWVHDRAGLALLKHGRWAEAETAFRRALELDVDDAPARVGLAHSLLRRGRYPEAAEWALDALALGFDRPLAHFNLGVALARMGEPARAQAAFETCVRFAPEYRPAHRFLALLARQRGDAAGWQTHQRSVAQIESDRANARSEREAIRREAAERATERARQRTLSRVNPASPEEARTAPGALELVLVSGLPRSGTSLMMQCLAAGGLPPLSDDARPADADNPHGYLEWSPLRRLEAEPALIEQAAGRALKVTSAFLPALPRAHRYRVIFLRRPLAEIAASQLRLRGRTEPGTALPSPEVLTRLLDKHLAATLDLLRREPQVSMLEVEYGQLLADPAAALALVIEFLGPDRLPTPGRMAACVRR